MICPIESLHFQKNCVHGGVISFDLFVHCFVFSVLKETDHIACNWVAQEIYSFLTFLRIKLFQHKELEITVEFSFVTFIGYDPIYEFTITECISWESEGYFILHHFVLGYTEVLFNSKHVAINVIVTKIIIS